MTEANGPRGLPWGRAASPGFSKRAVVQVLRSSEHAARWAIRSQLSVAAVTRSRMSLGFLP